MYIKDYMIELEAIGCHPLRTQLCVRKTKKRSFIHIVLMNITIKAVQ